VPNIRVRTGTVLALTVLLATGALSETIIARVVGIRDGDTVTVLAPGNVKYRIRLPVSTPRSTIRLSAPGQSRTCLRLVFGKTVNLDCGKEESAVWSARSCSLMARTFASTRSRPGWLLALQAVRERANARRPAGLCLSRGCSQRGEGRPVARPESDSAVGLPPRLSDKAVLQQGGPPDRMFGGLSGAGARQSRVPYLPVVRLPPTTIL
jgi:hypothetical protein